MVKLLKKVAFSSDKDQLFFLGDVVNRGNKSLETLRFIKDLSENSHPYH
jgi:bis(5'-nucleosyl)-tetraphosphatase (symmetrical)